MAPEFDRTLRRWYCGQLVVLTVAALVWLLNVNHGFFFPLGGMVLIVWLLNAWWPAVETSHDWRRLRHVNYYVQTILQFTFLPFLLATLIEVLGNIPGVDQQGLIAVGMAYLIVMFVPVAYVVTSRIQSLIGRIIMLITALFSGLVGAHATMLVAPSLRVPPVFNMVSDAGVLGALGFVLTVGILMQTWHFRWPSWRLNPHANPKLIGGLLGIGVVFSLWNAFSAGRSWATTFTNWQFQFEAANWKMFLSGLEPGIAEEWLYRFAVLTLLLAAFKKSRLQLDGAVWLSGTLFGLWHVTNVFAGQPWLATVEQMLFAATLGWFLAVVYLYTGNIGFAMLIHGAIDILSMMASGSQTMSKPDAFEWQTIAVTVVIFAALTVFFLTGSRRRAIQAHVDERLLGFA